MGKTELWEINTEVWSLPINIEWIGDDYAYVDLGAGVPLLNLQYRTLKMAFDEYGYEENDRICITKMNLLQIATKSHEEDPEMVVRWTPRKNPLEEAPNESDEEDEFLEQLVNCGWFKDLASIKSFWSALCKHMMHWTIVQKKTIDLKFARITCLPFRPNWKEMLLSKYSNWTALDLRCDDNKAKEVMTDLLRPEYLYIRKQTRRIWHSLDIRPGRWFWTNITNLENTREAKLNEDYWDSVYNHVRSCLINAYSIYLSYLKEVQHPFPFVSVGDGESDPFLPKGWGRIASRDETRKERIVIPDSIDIATGEPQDRCFEYMVAQEKGLPEVPDI